MSCSDTGIFTGEDHDMDLRPVRVVPAVGDSSMIRKSQAGAALALLKRWGLGLLDPDVEAHKRELPEHWWLEENATPVPEGVQMYFPATLAGIRETLAELKERNRLPHVAWEANQETSVPKDEVLLNLWYYLAAIGYTVEPKVEKTTDGFLVRLIVKS